MVALEGGTLLSFPGPQTCSPTVTKAAFKHSYFCPQPVLWKPYLWKAYLPSSIVSSSRAGPIPLDAFLSFRLAGIVWNTRCLSCLIEIRLLISSVGFHLQLNGWWCLGYDLINKFNKHELRIYDEPDTVLSSGSPETNDSSLLSRSS
jgi:hypothetical protein